MGWENLAIRKNALTQGYYEKKVDGNQDGKPEVVKSFSKDDKSLFDEEFDFDSNGAIDYSRTPNKDGTYNAIFWNNNPDNNQVKTGVLAKLTEFLFGASYEKKADELSQEADSSEYEYVKGSNDYYKEMSEVSANIRELSAQISREKEQSTTWQDLGDLMKSSIKTVGKDDSALLETCKEVTLDLKEVREEIVDKQIEASTPKLN